MVETGDYIWICFSTGVDTRIREGPVQRVTETDGERTIRFKRTYFRGDALYSVAESDIHALRVCNEDGLGWRFLRKFARQNFSRFSPLW